MSLREALFVLSFPLMLAALVMALGCLVEAVRGWRARYGLRRRLKKYVRQACDVATTPYVELPWWTDHTPSRDCPQCDQDRYHCCCKE